MIHHVSIPAKDPEHVAAVLAELMGGYSGHFVGPIPGAFVALANDGSGTSFEVYPERTVLVAGTGEAPGSSELRESPAAMPFHVLLSVKVDRATIERVGVREGWRTRHFWRGPPGVKLFELYEMWIENRVLIEVATEEMIGSYLKIANGAANRELLARRAAAMAAVAP